jgi:hypothetical protein
MLISPNGRTLRRSIVPATADDGIVVAPAPADAAELESLFRDVSGPAVMALRVEPGPAYRVGRIALTVFRRESGDRQGGRGRAQRGLPRIVVTRQPVDSIFFTPRVLGEAAGA